jgi:hypothetical protein
MLKKVVTGKKTPCRVRLPIAKSIRSALVAAGFNLRGWFFKSCLDSAN